MAKKNIPTGVRLRELAKKWKANSLTDAEREEFEQWYNDFQDNVVTDYDEERLDQVGERIYMAIMDRKDPRVYRRITKVKWIAAAAIVFVAFTATLLFQLPRQKESAIENIRPGATAAVLEAANGRSYNLDSLGADTVLYMTSGIAVRFSSGTLVYPSQSAQTATSSEMNYLSTPKGGTIRVQLPDGSTVWLNAASSIRFPTGFESDNRTVTITGEAYFDIKKNAKSPFRVRCGNDQIEVLGTSFNVKRDDTEKQSAITLVSGSVRVISATGRNKVLFPGQHATLNKEKDIVVKEIDPTLLTAWKDGFFVFSNSSLVDLINDIANWYNVEIRFERPINGEAYEFVGRISREATFEEVLKILALNGVKCSVEERTLIIH